MPIYMYDPSYLILVLPFIALAAYSQFKVSSTYSKYSQVDNTRNLTGAEIARIILDRNGLNHVVINQVSGNLSDHYDPRNQTVNLSSAVYGQRSVAAAGVAAHEVGHAIQHANAYLPLKIRSLIAPIVSLTSNFVWIIIAMGFMFSYTPLISIGIIIFAGTVIFQLITLPVEFNASSRAIKQLDDGLIGAGEISGAKKVLNAAAFTYVAATLVALVQLLHLIRRNRD